MASETILTTTGIFIWVFLIVQVIMVVRVLSWMIFATHVFFLPPPPPSKTIIFHPHERHLLICLIELFYCNCWTFLFSFIIFCGNLHSYTAWCYCYYNSHKRGILFYQDYTNWQMISLMIRRISCCSITWCGILRLIK